MASPHFQLQQMSCILGASVADAAALEIALEGNVRTNGALAKNDAFLVQCRKLSTSTYSYAIAHLENSSVPANTPLLRGSHGYCND